MPIPLLFFGRWGMMIPGNFEEGKMKKAFLGRLVGMDIADAEEAIMAEGHVPHLLPEGSIAVPAIAVGNTILLWQKDGKIFSADPGDPFELEDDKWLD